jgi:hypothetical protein
MIFTIHYRYSHTFRYGLIYQSSNVGIPISHITDTIQIYPYITDIPIIKHHFLQELLSATRRLCAKYAIAWSTEAGWERWMGSDLKWGTHPFFKGEIWV